MLLPCIHDLRQVPRDQVSDSIEFVPSETSVTLQRYRLDPEFAYLPIAFDVDMLRLVTVKTIEEETIRAGDALDSWQSETPDSM
jgi:hypothetical protein